MEGMQIMHNYHTGYYSLLLLPIGVSLYLAIKFGSDFSILNKSLVVSSHDLHSIENSRLNEETVLEAINEAVKKNDNIFMIKGLPIKSGELAIGVQTYDKEMKFAASHKVYLESFINFYGMAKLHDGMLGVEKGYKIREALAARKAYDEFAKHGTFNVDGSDSIDTFLRKNNIKTDMNFDMNFFYGTNEQDTVNIVVFGIAQNKLFEGKKRIFSKGNALLLFNSEKFYLNVINC